MAEKKTSKTKSKATARKRRAAGSAAPAKVATQAAKVREAEHEAEVTSTMADSAHIDREAAEAEAQKPDIYSGADLGGERSAEDASEAAADARATSGDMEEREKDAAEADAKVSELTTPDPSDASDTVVDSDRQPGEPLPSRVPPDPEQPRSDKSPEELREMAAAPRIFSTADMTGGVPGSPTERKISAASKPFEGESATERKLRAMGLTGPGH